LAVIVVNYYILTAFSVFSTTFKSRKLQQHSVRKFVT